MCEKISFLEGTLREVYEVLPVRLIRDIFKATLSRLRAPVGTQGFLTSAPSHTSMAMILPSPIIPIPPLFSPQHSRDAGSLPSYSRLPEYLFLSSP